jgi:hypothetical protein
MRSKTSLGAAMAAMFIALATTQASAAAAPPEDACSLVTQAQVSAATGVSMGAGSHVTPTYLKTCTWAPSGSSGSGISALTLHVQTADQYEAGKQLLEQMETMAKVEKHGNSQPPVITPLSGIGDDAFYLDMANTMSLIAKKGNVQFKFVIYGNLPVEKKKAAEKTLALEVVSKL